MYLILAFVVAAAATASAQSERTTGSFTAPAVGRQTTKPQFQPVRPTGTVPVGALTRAARGNPIQMLNPRAPEKYYGPPEETVVPPPHATTSGRPSQEREEPRYAGVILFGFRW
jgi:hypothetical protein